MKIAIAGGTGFLGTKLIENLLRKKHEIILLTRKSVAELEPCPYRVMQWPNINAEDEVALLQCDAVINLAGDNIGSGKWSKEKKAKIYNSRITYTADLVAKLRSSTKLHTFISASAIGFYGDRKTEVLTEESHEGEGFLAHVCSDWEHEALKLKRDDLRVILLRTGIVLDRGGGLLQQVEPLFKNWVGGPVGTGRQIMSWIHIEDWLQAVEFCLDGETDWADSKSKTSDHQVSQPRIGRIDGPVNLVAPEPVSNRTFSLLMSKLFQQPVMLPAPATAVKLLLGEMSSLALDSQNVRPTKLLNGGFKFKFSDIRAALESLFANKLQDQNIYDRLQTTTWVKAPIEKVFAFYSNAKNLEKLMPPEYKFTLEKQSTEAPMVGTLLNYKQSFKGIPVTWQVKIKEWTPPQASTDSETAEFTDEQLSGPYSNWIHTHKFEALAGGTLISDSIDYHLKGGLVGRVISTSMVQKELAKVFSYRKKVMREIFSPKLAP